MSANSETKPYDGLLKDLERIHRREKVCKKTINDNIGHIINSLQQTLNTISNTNYSPQDEASQLASQLKSTSDSILKLKPLNEITKAHKEYFAYVSKLGKSIDKNFNKEAQNLCLNAEIPSDYLNSTIAEHYLREGKFHISESLNNEAEEAVDEEFENAMKKLHQILLECKNNNFEPALDWAEKNEKHLRDLNSDLLYELYEYKFNFIHKNQGKDAAMKFARENFKKFFPIYGLEIQKLMLSLNPKQSDSLDPAKEKEKSEALMGEVAYIACRIYNTTPQSAISLIAGTGTLALPKFVKYFSLYRLKLKDWTKEDEIPIAFDYSKENQYHSIFICPVTKEIITEDNPAMMLKCGHVISELAMKRIAHINHMKIKCPYCPTENTMSTIKKIYFN